MIKRENMKIATWNINSVRLRIAQVMKFLKKATTRRIMSTRDKISKINNCDYSVYEIFFWDKNRINCFNRTDCSTLRKS